MAITKRVQELYKKSFYRFIIDIFKSEVKSRKKESKEEFFEILDYVKEIIIGAARILWNFVFILIVMIPRSIYCYFWFHKRYQEELKNPTPPRKIKKLDIENIK